MARKTGPMTMSPAIGPLSLTPCFGKVKDTHAPWNRFSGFSPALKTPSSLTIPDGWTVLRHSAEPLNLTACNPSHSPVSSPGGPPRPSEKLFVVTRQPQDDWEGPNHETCEIVPELPPPHPAVAPAASTLKVYMHKGCTRDAHGINPRSCPDTQESIKRDSPVETPSQTAAPPGQPPRAVSAGLQLLESRPPRRRVPENPQCRSSKPPWTPPDRPVTDFGAQPDPAVRAHLVSTTMRQASDVTKERGGTGRMRSGGHFIQILG